MMYYARPRDIRFVLPGWQLHRLVCGIIVLATYTQGCTHKINFQSNPEGAEVWLVNTETLGRVALGKTPLKDKIIPHAPMALFEVEKPGFISKQVAVALNPGGDYNIVTSLLPLTPAYLSEKSRLEFASSLKRNLEEMKKLQSAISARIPEILELKDLVSSGQKTAVLKQEALMKDAWNGISSFHLLMGDFYASEGSTKEALIRYKMAFKLDPKNPEIQRRLQSLQKGKK